MYIINILVKPSENKNSHRKHRLSVTSGQRCIWSPVNTTHTHKHYWLLNMSVDLFPSRHTVLDWWKSRKHCTGIQIQLQVLCADYTGIVLLKHCKTESHSPLIREEKRCSCLYSPTKQLAIILSLKFDFYKTEKNKKKNILWYEECCKSLKTLWKAINQWLVPQISTLFASSVQNNTVKY